LGIAVFSLVVIPFVRGAIQRLHQRLKGMDWPFSNADIFAYTDFDTLVGE
jgi:hypothetical protein